mgnify:CR=1 FL=1
MLEWILILLVVAAVAGLLGFGTLSGLALTGIDLPLGGLSPARTHHATLLRPPEAAALPAPDAPPLRPRCRAPPLPSLSALLA